MKKDILAFVFFSILMSSCGGSTEQAPKTDSTSVAVDSTCSDSTQCDTTCVDTVK